jgi:hypothetical protein
VSALSEHVDAEHDNNEAKIEGYQPQRSAQRSKNDRWDDHEHAAEPGTPELKKRLTKLVAVRLALARLSASLA